MFRNGFAQFIKHPATLTAIALITLIPLAAWAEKNEPTVWQARLALPRFEEEGNRHTPRTTTGRYLPPALLRSRTITQEESPLYVASTTIVPAGVTLTLEPGVELFFHEYANLKIEGTLIVNGSQDDRVLFQTNEEHIANRVWSGIVFGPESRGDIRYAALRHASPAITCENNSSVDVADSIIELGNLGVFTHTQHCTLTRSIIQYVDTGIIALTDEFAVPTSTTINAIRDNIKTNLSKNLLDKK